MGDFRKLRVWRAAQDLAIDAHRVTSRMRGVGSSNLRDQLGRATMSVPNNIVEGNAHESPREFARYLGYALASVNESEGHLQLARDLGMIAQADFTRLLGEVVDVRKMLHGLIKRITRPGDDGGSG
jgi:four helix bundle protein